MKAYIGIKAVQAEPQRMAIPPSAGDPLGGERAGYRVRYEDGYESWSPAEAFEKAYIETPPEHVEDIIANLRAYVLFGEIPGQAPTASEEDGHCPEMRRFEALRMAISSPMVQYTNEAITERAAAFEAFIGGFPAATSLPYVQRMGIERDQLADRFEKLAEFMGTGTFHALAEEDQGLLIEQHSHMQGYLAVLESRLARASAAD